MKLNILHLIGFLLLIFLMIEAQKPADPVLVVNTSAGCCTYSHLPVPCMQGYIEDCQQDKLALEAIHGNLTCVKDCVQMRNEDVCGASLGSVFLECYDE